jgi:sigma-B regulation protein RsbU (phosphoserine phosphatase)
MANLHAWWHALTQLGMPCTAFLEHLNSEMLHWLPDNRFITMAFAVADASDHGLTFASAGHTTALLVSADGGYERLEPTGPPLGLLRGVHFTCERRPFRPGQRLVLFSDGVPDQRNPVGEEYGVERLVACVQRNASKDPATIVSAIFDEVAEHRGSATQDDDTTVAVLSRG